MMLLPMTDTEREDAIDAAYFEMCGGKTPAARRKAWNKHRELILHRSDKRQTEMAIEQGLPVHTPAKP